MVIEQATTEVRCASDTTTEMPAATPEPGSDAHREQFEIDDGGTLATNVAENEVNYPKGVKLAAISSALIIVLMVLGLDISIVAVTIPALSDQFQSIQDIAWYSTALQLVMCSFMFLWGKAYTLFSVKWLFMTSLATFEAGNVLCTFAQSSRMFIAGRAICGFGCAGLSGGVFTIFTHTFPLRQRALVTGLAGAIETLACIASPVVGGALITGWTWRACFGINIPLGLIGCGVIYVCLHLDPNPDENLSLKEKIKRLDLLGTAILAPAMLCLLLALQWGGTLYRWDDTRVIALFVLSGVLLSGFLLTEWRLGEKASLPFRILRNRSLLAGAFFDHCCNATVTVIEYYMSIYFQGVRGYSAAKTGVFALPVVVGVCIASPLAGGFTTWIGYYFPTMYVPAVLASVAVGILTTIDIDTSIAQVLCVLALLGFGIGAGIQAPQVAAQTVLKQSEVSIGISIVQFGAQMGPVLFLAGGAALFTNRLQDEIEKHSPTTNATSLENMGLTDIRNALGPVALKGVLTGYNEALVQTLYLPLALACVSIIGCVLIERKSVKKEAQNDSQSQEQNLDTA